VKIGFVFPWVQILLANQVLIAFKGVLQACRIRTERVIYGYSSK
jgi:hypothetical protein